MQHESVRGLHLVADIAGASGLGDLPLIEAVLREAAQAARATVLTCVSTISARARV
jgi:hypothetical protein